ncbi:hypothetical protein COO60DRAFT_276890 [Scenedesmus sp. NREL 46B-D3]|nr:hypothetical protein COO60DRAFT_276890 [Scenedesmus sp. NREL 46B-D3]
MTTKSLSCYSGSSRPAVGLTNQTSLQETAGALMLTVDVCNFCYKTTDSPMAASTGLQQAPSPATCLIALQHIVICYKQTPTNRPIKTDCSSRPCLACNRPGSSCTHLCKRCLVLCAVYCVRCTAEQCLAYQPTFQSASAPSGTVLLSGYTSFQKARALGLPGICRSGPPPLSSSRSSTGGTHQPSLPADDARHGAGHDSPDGISQARAQHSFARQQQQQQLSRRSYGGSSSSSSRPVVCRGEPGWAQQVWHWCQQEGAALERFSQGEVRELLAAGEAALPQELADLIQKREASIALVDALSSKDEAAALALLQQAPASSRLAWVRDSRSGGYPAHVAAWHGLGHFIKQLVKVHGASSGNIISVGCAILTSSTAQAGIARVQAAEEPKIF